MISNNKIALSQQEMPASVHLNEVAKNQDQEDTRKVGAKLARRRTQIQPDSRQMVTVTISK